MIPFVINVNKCEFIKAIANEKDQNTCASKKEMVRLVRKKEAPDRINHAGSTYHHPYPGDKT